MTEEEQLLAEAIDRLTGQLKSMDGRIEFDATATGLLAQAVRENADALREGLRNPFAAFASSRLKQSAQNTANAFDRLSAALKILSR